MSAVGPGGPEDEVPGGEAAPGGAAGSGGVHDGPTRGARVDGAGEGPGGAADEGRTVHDVSMDDGREVDDPGTPAGDEDGPGTPDPDAPLPPHLRDRPDRPRGEADIAKGRSQARLILLLLFAAIPFVVLLVVVLNSLASGPPDRSVQAGQGQLNQVTRYCIYKARNDGQYKDCLTRADPRVIRREDSNAARYARGEITRCLADAGVRCTLR